MVTQACLEGLAVKTPASLAQLSERTLITLTLLLVTVREPTGIRVFLSSGGNPTFLETMLAG